MNRGASIAEGEKALNAELMRLTTEPVSDMELEKQKQNAREYAFGRDPFRRRHSRWVTQP